MAKRKGEGEVPGEIKPQHLDNNYIMHAISFNRSLCISTNLLNCYACEICACIGRAMILSGKIMMYFNL